MGPACRAIKDGRIQDYAQAHECGRGGKDIGAGFHLMVLMKPMNLEEALNYTKKDFSL